MISEWVPHQADGAHPTPHVLPLATAVPGALHKVISFGEEDPLNIKLITSY